MSTAGQYRQKRRLVRLLPIAAVVLLALAGLFALYFSGGTAPVNLDSTVSTNPPVNANNSPTVVFISDTTGYAFYVDSDSSCNYRKTTDGGATWATEVNNFDSVNTADCVSVAVWYDRWTPGDTTGNYIHVATLDTGVDDIYYTRLDTTDDSKTTSVVTSTQTASVSSAANAVTITKATNGTLHTGLIDATDTFFLSCSVSCTTANMWVEMATSGVVLADTDYVIMVPLADNDIMVVWYDYSVTSILWREWDDSSGWLESWATISSTINLSISYDAQISVVQNKSTYDLYLVVGDDITVNTTANAADILTFVFSGGVWTAKTNILTNIPQQLTAMKVAMDETTGDLVVAYTLKGLVTDIYSTVSYMVTSRDGMVTWGDRFGPIQPHTDDYFGLNLNYLSSDRIYVTYVDTLLDDLFGETLADLTSGVKMYLGSSGTQSTSFVGGTSNQYVGAAFTLRRLSGSATLESVSVSETGTIIADTEVTNLDLYYEVTESCSYDGNEALFGTDTDFSAGDVAVVGGSVSIGTDQVCFYPVFDLVAGAAGTLRFELTVPSTDIVITGGGAVTESIPMRLNGLSTVRPSAYSANVVLDSTASDLVGEGLSTTGTTVFVSDTVGYSFYVDSDASCNYRKTTDGGATWGTEVNNFDSVNTADCLGVAVWYDRWTPGDTTGNYIHVATIDIGVDDIYYTRLDTTDDSRTASIVTLTQAAALTQNTNNVSITKTADGQLFTGIIDASDAFVLRCTTGCTVAQSWIETDATGVSLGDDHLILLPDGNDLVAIWFDVSTDSLYSREWASSTSLWKGSGWTTIATSIDDSTLHPPNITATFRASPFAIYLVTVNDAGFLGQPAGADDLLTYRYNGSSWTTTTPVITDSPNPVLRSTIVRDSANDVLYSIYAEYDPTDYTRATIRYKTSTDGMATWTASDRILNEDTLIGLVSLGANFLSEDRIFLTWMDSISDDYYGVLVEDITSGSLGVDIVDSGGSTVGSPVMTMSSAVFSFAHQVITGIFGISSERVRVTNGTGASAWTLSVAAAGGATAFWDGTTDYDFNDPTASAGDGGDADSLGGQMTVDPSVATVSPEDGCGNTGVSLGSSSAFNQGVTDSITLVSADGSADTNCYWDITGIGISQTVPAEQGSGSYQIDMTLSIIAS